jgi:hypothetical protein
MASVIFKFGSRCCFTSRPFYFPWKRPRHPLNWRLECLQGRCERFGEEINFVLLTGIEPRFLGRPASSLVTSSTTDVTDFAYSVTQSRWRRAAFLSIITDTYCFCTPLCVAANSVRWMWLIITFKFQWCVSDGHGGTLSALYWELRERVN